MAEARNYWKVDGESLDDVKITLKKGRGNIVGISPVEDYIHRPPQLDDMNLYDWISLSECVSNKTTSSTSNKESCNDVIEFEDIDNDINNRGDLCDDEPDDEPGDDDVNSLDRFIVPSKHDGDSQIDTGSHQSKRKRTSKYHRYKFSWEHPLHESHHVRVCPVKDQKVPNFVGGMLPRKDKGDREYYCTSMLVLFKPWRTGADLKVDQDTTWDAVFENYSFSEAHTRIMANFNLRYECLDARDDYRA
ncbi:hypothetical protein ARMSODRAFT_1061253, partial [Armillaria solidipes]